MNLCINGPPTIMAVGDVAWCLDGWAWSILLNNGSTLHRESEGVHEFPTAQWALIDMLGAAEQLDIFLTEITIEPLDFTPGIDRLE